MSSPRTPRPAVWRTHNITLAVLAAVVAVAAFEVARSDAHDQLLKLGGVLAFLLVVAFFVYAFMSSVLVAMVAKRPIHVLGAHLGVVGMVILGGLAMCVRA